MRSELGKECRKLFRKMMAVEFPEYHEDKGQIVPPGWYVWTRQHTSKLWLHILLVVHPTSDEFTTEAAWSHDGKTKGYTVQQPEKFMSEANRVRVSRLWCGRDDWWLVFVRKNDPVEQCLPVVASTVWDAGEKLKEHLVPAFEQIVQKHGKQGAAPTGSSAH
jgi:hypothetical protein